MWSTPAHIRICAVIFGLLICLISVAADSALHWFGFGQVATVAVSDGVAGTFAAFFVIRLMDERLHRRRRVEERLRLIADLNHHIRNALSTIQLTCYVAGNQQAIEAVDESIRRIDWALREVLQQQPSRKPPRSESAEEAEEERRDGS